MSHRRAADSCLTSRHAIGRMKRSYWKMWNGGIQSYLCSCHVSTAILIYQDGNARRCEPYSCPSRVHRDSHTTLKYINHWRGWLILVHLGPLTLRDVLAAAAPAAWKLYLFSRFISSSWSCLCTHYNHRNLGGQCWYSKRWGISHSPNHTYQFVNCRFN